jgi:hypothetical protein
MKIELLKEGDVIHLSNGMKVYTQIPAMFVYSNRKTSTELTSNDVVIGKKYYNDTNIEGVINKVSKGIVERFNWEGIELNLSEAKEFVLSKIEQPKRQKFIVEEGDFVVVKTQYSGGGIDMGRNDVYADGYRVYCKKLKDGVFDKYGIEVSFYQNGSFTCIIPNIKPIRKLKQQFV